MNSQVRQLDLRLSLPEALRSESWSIAQELRHGFIRRVVEVVEERMHAEFGADAVVEIPNLIVAWDGVRESFVDIDYARRVGESLATDVVRNAQAPQVGDPMDMPGGSGVIVYRNTVHRSAVHIASLSMEQLKHTTAARREAIESEWLAVMDRGPEQLRQCMITITAGKAGPAAVAAISQDMQRLMTSVLPVREWPKAFRKEIELLLSRSALPCASEESGNEGVVDKSELPGGRHPGSGREAQPDTAKRAVDDGPPGVGETEADLSGAEELTLPSADSVALTRESSSVTEEGAAAGLGAARRATLSDPESPGHTEFRDSTNRETAKSVGDTLEPAREGWSTQQTDFGGLAYLLNLIQKIELPEMLWCCGIDEPSFLYDLFREAIGASDTADVIVNAVSGIDDDETNYRVSEIPKWAADEIRDKIRQRLSTIASVEWPSGRDTWNCHETEFARLDASPRSWSALVHEVATALAKVFEALIWDEESRRSIRSAVSVSGVIRSDTDTIVVILPMESIDINVRRAGLDQDPGYLPWLKQTLRIEFRE